jgi:uncharacterized membrane protein YGL010W
MNRGLSNSKRDRLLAGYAHGGQDPEHRFMHWVYLPAIVFSALGMLFAINFGIALIAIALAILYYSQYGQLVAAQLGAALLAMLAIWMLVMPAHYLVIASLGIFLLALASQCSGRVRAGGPKRSFTAWKHFLLAGPVYALAIIR